MSTQTEMAPTAVANVLPPLPDTCPIVRYPVTY